MKKWLCMLMAALLAVAVIGCKKAAKPKEEVLAYKIGVITGCAEADAEECCAAIKMQEKYGDMLLHATYADSNTLIQSAQMLAGDSAVRAIIIIKAGAGTVSAIDKVREINPDMLIICAEPQEDISAVAGKADIVLLQDAIGLGAAIPQKAAQMGATTLIHYSYSSVLNNEAVAACRELMIAACEQNGITYLDVTAPDPTGGAGVDAAKQFILDDVARQVMQYGADTAFFSTVESFHEPLIKAVLEQGAIFPYGSLFRGYPAALNIDVSGHECDASFVLDKIKEKLTEKNQQQRMYASGVALNKLILESSIEYAIRYLDGTTDERLDEGALISLINKYAGGEEKCAVSSYTAGGMTIPNCYALLCDFYDFAE